MPMASYTSALTSSSASVSDKMPAAPQIKPLDVIKAQTHKAQIDAAWSKAALSR